MTAEPELARQLVSAMSAAELQVVAASSIASAAELHTPQIVIVDLEQPPLADPSQLRQLSELNIRLIAISTRFSGAAIEQLRHNGVSGFLSRNEAAGEAVAAVKAVLAGGSHISSEATLPAPHLSDQERTAIRLYAAGMKLDSVARRMGVASSTAKEYIDRARAKYAAVGRPAPTKLHLHRNAVEDGLLADGDYRGELPS